MKTRENKSVDKTDLNIDEYWMRQALDLATRGEGLTRPNPPVGAVVVKNGRLIASGYHRRAGADHAERMALLQAGRAAHGATLYVSLEPCSTYGRTPPCTDLVIHTAIKRVVIAACDRNPKHNGKGVAILRNAGISVDVGVCRNDAEEILAPFTHWILKKTPLVSLKLAITADGMIADKSGASQWITGRESRKYVHGLRQKADAIMVGVNTVIADDPCLLPRPAHGRKPWRIVVDSNARIPPTAQLINDRPSQTLVAVTHQANQEKVAILERCGVTVLRCKTAGGRVDLPDLLEHLGRMGLLHVVCEGGGCLAGELVRTSLVDRLFLFMAPSFLGGSGIHALGTAGWYIQEKPVFTWDHTQQLGRDILLTSKMKKRRILHV